MQKVQDIETIIKEASDRYPLNTATSNWELVNRKLDLQKCPNNISKRLMNIFSLGRTHGWNSLDEGLIYDNEIKLMPTTFKNKNYWKRYPLYTHPELIERCVSIEVFTSCGKEFELLRFYKNASAENVLISPGVASHAFVFAELGYLIHQLGYNVFIMPKHGGHDVPKLIKRHEDAVQQLNTKYASGTHLYGEGLGGIVAFYLALSRTSNIKTIICENAPAILTDRAFHEAVNNHGATGNRVRLLLPLFKILTRLFPSLKVSIKTCLDWEKFIDFNNEDNRNIEKQLVRAYKDDPDFDRSYSLKTMRSFVRTPPSRDLSSFDLHVMFILAKRGIAPEYFENLYKRLPTKHKLLEKVNGGFFWMISHPQEAASLIVNWISNYKKPIKNE